MKIVILFIETIQIFGCTNLVTCIMAVLEVNVIVDEVVKGNPYPESPLPFSAKKT